MALAYVLDDIFADHRPPNPHPERPERFTAARDALRDAGLAKRGTLLASRAAEESELGLVHTAGYLSTLTKTVPGKSGWLDADTYYSPETWRAAVTAAGAAIDATSAVMSGEFERAMAIVRPPGHHAEADRAMGFCLLNNVGIAAAAAREAGAARVAIVDWDVHHGNGTQHSFYSDPSVLYMSTHQYPFYPGTGASDEIGEGAGVGATVNVALPSGCGDDEYIASFEQVIVPELRRFHPDLILISAGFDAYTNDPLAGMCVSAAGYGRLAELLRDVAVDTCDGRLVCVLEGGYDLEGLGSGMVHVLDAMDPRTHSDAAVSAPAAPAKAGKAAFAITQTRTALARARGEESD